MKKSYLCTKFQELTMTAYLYATNLPSNLKFAGLIAHTFITIENDKCETVKYAAYGPQYNVPFFGMNMLARKFFLQDQKVYTGEDKKNLKAKIKIPVPQGKTEEQFIHDLIEAIDQYDATDMLRYNFIPLLHAEGNCNTSTSTILQRSGVPMSFIHKMNRSIFAFNTGFAFRPKPWTLSERRTVLQRHNSRPIAKFSEMNRRALRSCPSIVHLLHFRIPEIERCLE
ncbi:MAG: hypothetical protein KBT33_12775 [Prevotellaceae bacterium]|nr:hypothetical protein [Candidatus Minthosoma equi]